MVPCPVLDGVRQEQQGRQGENGNLSQGHGLVWQHILFQAIDGLSVKPSHAVTGSFFKFDRYLAESLSFKPKTKSRLAQRNSHGCRHARLRQSRAQT
jgi:hypothetical protein